MKREAEEDWGKRGRFRPLNLWTALSELRRGLEFSWAAKPETDTLAINLPLLLAFAVPLSCLAFLSLLALLGVATLGAGIHVLGTIRARWPQWPSSHKRTTPAG
jgi:hypothetical protein